MSGGSFILSVPSCPLHITLTFCVLLLCVQRMGLDFHAVHNEEGLTTSAAMSAVALAGPSTGPSPQPARASLPCRYWHPLLTSLHQRGHHAMVLEVVASMGDVQVVPDKHCCLRAVQAALATGQHDLALHTVEQMQAASEGGQGEQPDISIYGPILKHLASSDRPAEVIGVIAQMDAAGVPVDSDTWTCVEAMRRFDVVLEAQERTSRQPPADR